MTAEPRRIFREEALRRYADGRQADGPLDDLDRRLLRLLWFGAGLLLGALGVVAVVVVVLLQGSGGG